MSGYLIFTMPNITVREDDTDLLTVTIDLLTSTPADAYEAAADVIRRIQSDREEELERTYQNGYKAGQYFGDLDGEADTIAAADRDAIAAAEKRGERRGVEREREAAAYWLEKRPNTFEHTPQWYANRLRRGSHLAQYIKDGVHLNGGESDDS